MQPFDLPDNVFDLMHSELCRPPAVRERESYLSRPAEDEHHEQVEAPETNWRVMPLRAGDPTVFFGDGTYLFLRRANSVPVVYVHAEHWRLLGKYGECDLPASFPSITFPDGVEQVAVVPAAGPAAHVGSAAWEPNLRIV